MMPGPGRGWALVMWDQDAILWTPEEYCRVTVFPAMSALRFSPRDRELTDIGKLPVFENDKVQLFTELLELLCKLESKVLNDVAMCLLSAGGAELRAVVAYFDHANTRSDRFDNLENLLGGRHVDRDT
jgi:hypothetical protein